MKGYYSEETVTRLKESIISRQTSIRLELAAPIEELLTVAIDDTANTLFITGITGFLCH